MGDEAKLRAVSWVLVNATTETVVADVRTHTREEDARRLAARWNACAGIPTEALEAGTLVGALEALEEAADMVCAEYCSVNHVYCEPFRAILRALGRL